MFETILAAAHRFAPRSPGIGGFIFGLVTPVAILLVTVGIFYVLIKLGSFIDALKEKTEAKK
jgi:hypothetical protein